MSTLYKEYVKLENGQEIKFSISFNKESRNWATSQPTPIGYRVTVTPVKRSTREGGYIIEESGAFTGFNDTLLEFERQSKKRLQSAIDELQIRKELYLEQFKPGERYEPETN